jgi:hypothetical protein
MISLLYFEELHAGIIHEFMALRKLLNNSPHGTLFVERDHLGALEQRVMDFWHHLHEGLTADQGHTRAVLASYEEMTASFDELHKRYQVARDNGVESMAKIVALEEEIKRLKGELDAQHPSATA